MKNMLANLIAMGGPELVPGFRPVQTWKGLKGELCGLLSQKNGFYAFDSALLVRPLGASTAPASLERWNDPSLWIDSYGMELPDLYFFAEDIFGGQFALGKDGVVSFDPETGELNTISDSLEGWAKELLSDDEYLTGSSLAASWQKDHGSLPLGTRLVPRQLFVLGGGFETSNFMCLDEVKGMRSRGFFATALREVPDGGQVTFEFVD